MDYFGSTNKGPPVYVASGNTARASRPRRGKRRKPTRKGRKRAPPKRTVSEIYRRKHNKTHLRDMIREERAQYRPQTNDEFSNENLNADVVIESLNLNNESISGEKGKIGGRRRTRRRRKRRRKRRTRRRSRRRKRRKRRTRRGGELFGFRRWVKKKTGYTARKEAREAREKRDEETEQALARLEGDANNRGVINNR